jgi:hypothetical protein
MPFGSKDLMMKALPQCGIDPAQFARLCLFRTFICRWPTLCFVTCYKIISYCGRCSLLLTEMQGCQIAHSCGVGGSVCDPTQFCAGTEPWLIQDLEDLVTIRAELNQTLRQLDSIEKEGLASGITTRQQADELEQTLKGQLEHLRKVREGLK